MPSKSWAEFCNVRYTASDVRCLRSEAAVDPPQAMVAGERNSAFVEEPLLASRGSVRCCAAGDRGSFSRGVYLILDSRNSEENFISQVRSLLLWQTALPWLDHANLGERWVLVSNQRLHFPPNFLRISPRICPVMAAGASCEPSFTKLGVSQRATKTLWF
jgi:hypothetical protein